MSQIAAILLLDENGAPWCQNVSELRKYGADFLVFKILEKPLHPNAVVFLVVDDCNNVADIPQEIFMDPRSEFLLHVLNVRRLDVDDVDFNSVFHFEKVLSVAAGATCDFEHGVGALEVAMGLLRVM